MYTSLRMRLLVSVVCIGPALAAGAPADRGESAEARSDRPRVATEALVAELQSPESLRRFGAIKRLGEGGDKAAVPHLVASLQDPDEKNRYWALDALVRLQAKEAVPDIWRYQKVATGKEAQTLAVAALVAFGDKEAVPLAVKLATVKDVSDRGLMLRRLVELQARAAVPALVALLESEEVLGGDIGTNSNIRRDVIGCLASLDAREVVPVLRKYVKRGGSFPDAAVEALGRLRAAEAVDDLVPLLDEKVSGDEYASVTAAVALARIGREQTFPALIDLVRRSAAESRGQVIVELNRAADPELWIKLQSVMFEGLYLKPADVTAEAMKRQCGVAVVLHGKPPAGGERPGQWPMVNTFSEKVVLATALESMIESLNVGLEAGYTYVFDDRQVHVMPLADAVKWWEARLKRAPAGAGKVQ